MPLLLLTLVLILGSMGLVYGLWSETLTINGTVNTGSVDAAWVFVICSDIEGKQVGTTSGQIDPQNNKLLHFTIGNGYPSYTGDCQVEFRNTGTIPVRVEEIKFTPGDGLTNCSVTQSPTTGSFTAKCDQLEVEFVDNLCVQLHPGDKVASSIRVHVEQGAGENSTYKFRVDIKLVQYNESTCS